MVNNVAATTTGAVAAVTGIIGGLFGWFAQRGKNQSDDSISVRNEWGKLFTAVSARCTDLEEAEQRCRTELADVKERLAALEGYQSGIGKARQEAANIVAIERTEKP